MIIAFRSVWRFGAIALLVLGAFASTAGTFLLAEAAPASLRCDRASGTCELQTPSVFGRSDAQVFTIASLHDSRVITHVERGGPSHQWVVDRDGMTLRLGEPTDNAEQGKEYGTLANRLQRYLDDPRRRRFDEQYDAVDLQGYGLLFFIGLVLLGFGVAAIRGAWTSIEITGDTLTIRRRPLMFGASTRRFPVRDVKVDLTTRTTGWKSSTATTLAELSLIAHARRQLRISERYQTQEDRRRVDERVEQLRAALQSS